MAKIEEFLTQQEEEEVVEAIRQAEKKTSGEIRVHIEKSSKGDIWKRAMEVFHLLKMDNTKQDNGVLIYVAIDDRNFVIYGDKGINDVVPPDFWESTKDEIVAEFKKGNFKQGLINGITRAGHELQVHFPWDEGTDENQLSDKISR
ncbi:TLP18.3, Psb32 and MOLO-1 founding protein of phosphatase [Salinimicrobium catena]|uniref:TLP18.3, Psb32 and MOLO-1 founding protein of phosphatase n=1 Tax=Salinimicrobium catena TaxID=390640 RepID=A0A1H5GWL8_9FLAO|nr:TPM domain-containing protein [Salinimicrobium catena]SDK66233.1 TLP18.3, Psb32 and MOLO-1 founding protein of phosphatase [Salinimicrobium catena]SEE20119.1 TLP18.3, Psb32 and MOLO-1 founding protein of phosphatase [Salinimicrobium catena]